MTIRIYKTLEQGTPEWHEARRGIITASEIGALLTKTGQIARDKAARALILTKAAQRITGYVDVQKQTFAMERGHDDEAEARDLYGDHIAPVEEVGFITRDFGDVTLGYSPDGLVGDKGLIECKSRIQRFQIETIISQNIPDDYKAQIQSALLISGREWLDFISFPACGGGKMMVLRAYPDPDYCDVLLEAAHEAEARINFLVNKYQEAIKSGDARFFDTERRDYSNPADVEFLA